MPTSNSMRAAQAASAYYHAGQMQAALAAARQALIEQPDDPVVSNLLGVMLVQTGQVADGIAALTDAIRRWPDHDGIMVNLAMAYARLPDWAAAWVWLRRALVLCPSNAKVLEQLAQHSLNWRGDADGALRFARRAVRLMPDDPGALNTLAQALEGPDPIQAIHAWQVTAAIHPDDSGPLARQAMLQLGQGMLADAAASLNQTLRIDPNHRLGALAAQRCQRYHRASRMAVKGAPGPGAGFVLRTPFGTNSGYSHTGGRFIQTLRRQGVPLDVMGVMGHEAWAEENLDVPVPAKAAVSMVVPTVLEPIPGLATVLFSMFEGPRISDIWARRSQRADMIVVPTESSRQAWAVKGYPLDRIHLCPLGVDPAPEVANAPPLVLCDASGLQSGQYRHRFLNVSDAIPRKNLDGMLRVWLRATRRGDDAVLILKIGKGGSAKETRYVEDIVRRTQQAVGRRFADAAPIMWVDRQLTEVEMAGLFRTANYYWSLSHGEGWDLPLTKAGAMGMGLIAPAHSAYLDYLDPRFARMIPSKVGPAHLPYSNDPWEPFFGLDWWNPDEDAAAAILSGIIQGRDAALPDASTHLRANYTWDQSSLKLRRILADAGYLYEVTS